MKKYYEKNKDEMKKNATFSIIKKRLINGKKFNADKIDDYVGCIYYLNIVQKFYPKESLEYVRFSDMKKLIQGKQDKKRRTKKQIIEEILQNEDKNNINVVLTNNENNIGNKIPEIDKKNNGGNLEKKISDINLTNSPKEFENIKNDTNK